MSFCLVGNTLPGFSFPERPVAGYFHKGEYSPEQLFKEIQALLDQAPIRPHLPKPDKAPVWIPRNGNYVVLTCTACLRSFSIPDDEAGNGTCETGCVHCGTLVRFVLEST
jgi:hypothetical protein